MFSPQETSDRLEIMAALAQYADAVDRQEFDALDLVFLPDADLDYTEIAPYRGDLAYTKEWLKVMPPSGTYQHLMVLPTIQIDGDTAETRTPCINPMPAEKGMSFFGHWYHDHWVRTPNGWRIKSRHFEACYKADVPRA